MTEKLKFAKMWEAANTYVEDIDSGSIRPILETVPKIMSYTDKQWFYFFQNGMGGAYYEENEMQLAKQAGLYDFQQKSFQQKYFNGISDCLKRHKKVLEQIDNTDICSPKVSINEIKDLFLSNSELTVENFGYFLGCQPQYILGLEELALAQIGKTTPAENAREVFTLLCTPLTLTRLREEELKWLDLLILAKKHPLSQKQLQQKLKAHHKKYSLDTTGDGNPPKTTGEYSEQFSQDLKQDLPLLEQKRSAIIDAPDLLLSKQKEFIAKYNVSKKAQQICKLLAKIGHERLELRIRGWMPGQYYNQVLIAEIERRLKVADLRFATTNEVLDFLDNKKISGTIIAQRKKAFIFGIEGKSTYLLGGDAALERFKSLVGDQDYSQLKQVTGAIAMKGKVTGRVIVVKWTDDLNSRIADFSPGSILVAGQTRPQLMPLITKASAIVTDEGGITSHAAIVSRELGIPCIIGTKIGTQVFKDGDLVEVDANTGIVRKI